MDGSVIPIADMRFGGANFKNDTDFLETAKIEAKRLMADCNIHERSSVLDIGCGTGRLPTGLLRTFGENINYTGIDVSEAAIAWCKRHIQKTHPTYKFIHINMENKRYNPHGKEFDDTFHLPLEGTSFDVIYLYSVFSHMELKDVETYLKEFQRLLKPKGTIFLTTFIEENVPDFEANPKNYRALWKGALHCVRFNKEFFIKTVGKYGFIVDKFDYAKETDGQSGVYLKKLKHE